MTTTLIKAVYRDGAFYPTIPPELADGTPVELRLDTPDPVPLTDGPTAYEIITAITRRSARRGGVDDAAANHDKYLYGEPGDPGDVR